jgi:hypothetical protein
MHLFRLIAGQQPSITGYVAVHACLEIARQVTPMHLFRLIGGQHFPVTARVTVEASRKVLSNNSELLTYRFWNEHYYAVRIHKRSNLVLGRNWLIVHGLRTPCGLMNRLWNRPEHYFAVRIYKRSNLVLGRNWLIVHGLRTPVGSNWWSR